MLATMTATKQINVRVSEDLEAKLRKVMALKRWTLTAAVTAAIEALVASELRGDGK